MEVIGAVFFIFIFIFFFGLYSVSDSENYREKLLSEIKIAVFAGGNARSYQFVIVHLIHVGGHLLVKFRLTRVKNVIL